MPRSKTRRHQRKNRTRKQLGGKTGQCYKNDMWGRCRFPTLDNNMNIVDWKHIFGPFLQKGKDHVRYCEKCGCFVVNPIRRSA